MGWDLSHCTYIFSLFSSLLSPSLFRSLPKSPFFSSVLLNSLIPLSVRKKAIRDSVVVVERHSRKFLSLKIFLAGCKQATTMPQLQRPKIVSKLRLKGKFFLYDAFQMTLSIL